MSNQTQTSRYGRATKAMEKAMESREFFVTLTSSLFGLIHSWLSEAEAAKKREARKSKAVQQKMAAKIASQPQRECDDALLLEKLEPWRTPSPSGGRSTNYFHILVWLMNGCKMRPPTAEHMWPSEQHTLSKPFSCLMDVTCAMPSKWGKSGSMTWNSSGTRLTNRPPRLQCVQTTQASPLPRTRTKPTG